MEHQVNLGAVFAILNKKAENDPLLRAQLEAAVWEAVATAASVEAPEAVESEA